MLILALVACEEPESPLQVEVDQLAVPVVRRVEVSLPSGDIHVRGGETSSLQTVKRWRGDRPPTVDTRVSGGLLQIDVTCPAQDDACSVDLDLTLPPDVVTQVVTRAGDIRLEGLSGEVFAYTGAGVLDLFDLSGPVDVRTGSGDIVGVDLSSEVVEVHLDAGAVELSFQVPPTEVWIEVDAGSTELVLPARAYALELLTMTGEVSIEGVDSVPTAERRVTVVTRQGNISLRGG